MSGSFGFGQQESSGRQRIWQKQSPYLQDLYARSQALLDSQPDQNATQIAGQQMALGYADQMGGQVLDPALDAWRYALNAPDVSQNPYLAQQAEAAARPLQQNLTESILPAIRSGAMGAGQYGSSRQAIAEGIAARGTQQAIADQTAGLYGNAYAQGLQAQSNALAQAGNVANLGLLPGQVYQNVGQQQQLAPWMQLERYSSLLGQPVSLSKTNSSGFDISLSGGM